MPSLKVPINDVMLSVERPVVFAIIRQLMDLTGISDKTLIRFYGVDQNAPQWGSFTIGKQDTYSNLWPHRDNITIEVEEDDDPNHILSSATSEIEVPLVFADRKLGIGLKPIYSPTQVTIRVVYRCADKNEAQKWRNDIRIRVGAGREIQLHRAAYSYALPQPFEVLLEHLYDLRSAIGGDGLSLSEWWAQCASPKFTKVVTQAGTHPVISVAETQGDLQGYFDFESIPEKPTKSNEPEMWELSFGYRFKYDKPIAMHARYPLLVHQQMVAPVFRNSGPAQKYQAVLKELTLSGTFFERFGSQKSYAARVANAGICLPVEDDWQPMRGTVPSNTINVFTGLTSISPDNRRDLLDLNSFDQYRLIEPVLQFMRQAEYPHMQRPGGSIFNVAVYEGTNVVDWRDVEITPQLMVRSRRDLDLTKVYHVRLSLYGNMLVLDGLARARLRANKQIAQTLCLALNAALGNYGQLTDLRKSRLNDYDYSVLGLPGQAPMQDGWSLFYVLYVQVQRMGAEKDEIADPQAIERPLIPD